MGAPAARVKRTRIGTHRCVGMIGADRADGERDRYRYRRRR
jgi:hypothetical protein